MCINTFVLQNPTAKRLWLITDVNRVEIQGTVFTHFLTIDDVYKHYMTHYADVVPFTNDKDAFRRSPEYQCNNYTVTKSCYLLVGDLRVPLFNLCKCGKCDQCKDERRRNYSTRAVIEAADNSFLVFYTLTYDDAHLPFCGLCRDDVVSFHKRFRENLAIWHSNRFKSTLKEARERTQYRTFYVGEYGKKRTCRAHYHGVFFFKHPFFYGYIDDIYRIFNMSWGNSSLPDKFARKCFQICKSPVACARYITKYITKQDTSYVPEGKNPLFVQGPVKNGALGCSNLGSHIRDILYSTDGTFEVNVKGKVTKLGVPRQILDKIYPSFSRIYKDACDLLSQFKYAYDQFERLKVNSPYSELSYCYVWDRYKYLCAGFSNMTVSLSFVDFIRKLDLSELYDYLTQCYIKMLDLPEEDEFITCFLGKFRYIKRLNRSIMSYEDYMSSLTAMHVKNLNYVNNHMLADNYCPF